MLGAFSFGSNPFGSARGTSVVLLSSPILVDASTVTITARAKFVTDAYFQDDNQCDSPQTESLLVVQGSFFSEAAVQYGRDLVAEIDFIDTCTVSPLAEITLGVDTSFDDAATVAFNNRWLKLALNASFSDASTYSNKYSVSTSILDGCAVSLLTGIALQVGTTCRDLAGVIPLCRTPLSVQCDFIDEAICTGVTNGLPAFPTDTRYVYFHPGNDYKIDVSPKDYALILPVKDYEGIYQDKDYSVHY
jgi:hypothetical protein